jgi:L-ascorbate metabolism protein UlaG (beta-lactamase superfamily)
MKNNPFLALEQLYAGPETQAIRQQMVSWMESTYEWVDVALAQHPPAWPEPAIRRQALLMLDEPLHVLSAPIEPCLNTFLNRRIERAVAEIEREVVTSGMTLWKLYNHGFVVKTPQITIGFDLHRGPFETFRIEFELFDRLLQATQALFISHEHSDHADADAIPRMVELGRPVIAPPGLWEGTEFYPKLIRPERRGEMENRLALGDIWITYRVFPGHQGTDLLNNVTLVELPNGQQVMHTGDQSNSDDFGLWIDGMHEHSRVDVLLPNCWSTDLPRLIRGVAPRVVVTGHEDEMSHPVDHREAFSKTYGHIVGETTPVVVMAWGERLHYEQGYLMAAAEDAHGQAMEEMQNYMHAFG